MDSMSRMANLTWTASHNMQRDFTIFLIDNILSIQTAQSKREIIYSDQLQSAAHHLFRVVKIPQRFRRFVGLQVQRRQNNRNGTKNVS